MVVVALSALWRRVWCYRRCVFHCLCNFPVNLNGYSIGPQARAFNDNIINARKCSLILTKILYIINQVSPRAYMSSLSPLFSHCEQGTSFNSTEATETFFAITKLWQSKDVTLRRLVYLAVKEMATMANDVIIVTSR